MPLEKLNKIDSQGQVSEAEADKMIKYSKDTARPLELSYWESKKTESQEVVLAEVRRMIKYSIDTARPLELSYWEAKERELKNRQRGVVKKEQQEPDLPTMEDKETGKTVGAEEKEPEREKPVAKEQEKPKKTRKPFRVRFLF